MTLDAERSNTRVAFIIGAGISAPYGFPVGDAYRRMLLKMADWERGAPLELFDPKNEDDAVARNEAASRLLGRFLGHKVDTQRRRIIGGAFRASGAVSIDRFVSGAVRDGRKSAREIARKLVVILLSCCEPDRKMDHGAYAILLDLLGLDEPRKTELKPASFISFNYDRCFERAMFERDGCVIRGNVTHVYGEIGMLYDPITPRQQGNGYLEWASWQKANMHEGQLDRYAGQVEFINTPNERPRDARLAHLRHCIASANTLVFLGFGFDPYNCRYLGLPQHDPERGWQAFDEDTERSLPDPISLKDKTLLATTYGMANAEVNLIVDALLGPTRDERWKEQRARFQDMACEPFLNRYKQSLEQSLR